MVSHRWTGKHYFYRKKKQLYLPWSRQDKVRDFQSNSFMTELHPSIHLSSSTTLIKLFFTKQYSRMCVFWTLLSIKTEHFDRCFLAKQEKFSSQTLRSYHKWCTLRRTASERLNLLSLLSSEDLGMLLCTVAPREQKIATRDLSSKVFFSTPKRTGTLKGWVLLCVEELKKPNPFGFTASKV